MPPTLAPGKVVYIQIPALDVGRSADFYETVFAGTSGETTTEKSHSTTRLAR